VFKGFVRPRARGRPRIGEEIIDELDGLLGARRAIIPRRWRCALGTGAELSRTLRNLSLISVAHVVSITNGAIGAGGGQRPNVLYPMAAWRSNPERTRRSASTVRGGSMENAPERPQAVEMIR